MPISPVKKFTVFFCNGESMVIEGDNLFNARKNAGIVIADVHFYGNGDARKRFYFCKDYKTWKRKTLITK